MNQFAILFADWFMPQLPRVAEQRGLHRVAAAKEQRALAAGVKSHAGTEARTGTDMML